MDNPHHLLDDTNYLCGTYSAKGQLLSTNVPIPLPDPADYYCHSLARDGSLTAVLAVLYVIILLTCVESERAKKVMAILLAAQLTPMVHANTNYTCISCKNPDQNSYSCKSTERNEMRRLINHEPPVQGRFLSLRPNLEEKHNSMCFGRDLTLDTWDQSGYGPLDINGPF